MPDAGTLLLVAAICLAGGFIGGIVGVGGGIVFVPAMSILLDLTHLEAEATSLLIIAIVCLAGTLRQRRYKNVNLRHAAWIAALSPPGVLAGVVVANNVSERALELAFAALLVFVALELLRKPGGEPPGGEPLRGGGSDRLV